MPKTKFPPTVYVTLYKDGGETYFGAVETIDEIDTDTAAEPEVAIYERIRTGSVSVTKNFTESK